MPHFVATYAYTDDTAARDATRPEHRRYLASLGERLVLSGPTDADGAVLVFEAGSAAEVEEILDADPFTRDGIVAARTLVGWNPVLGRLHPQL
ncbi:YciI family protein [Kineococcus glutinatus]|uniref:YCII-related domain-containing protein n=1 Tax=Kineococcus glutinatus TaxID=1070872 RepID=A0ABP8VM16_9ACTN